MKKSIIILLLISVLCAMEVDLNIDKRIFNPKYLKFLNDTTRTQIFFGGSSSGKSVFTIGQRMIIDLMKGGRNYLAARNVGRTLRDSVFNEALQGISRLKVEHLFKVNKSDMTITCANGYQAILKGLDDVQKIKSVRPQKGVVTDILCEEATEMSYDDIKELTKRLRGESKVPKRITFLFNPIMRSHWIYQTYFAGKFGDNDTCYKDDNLLILKTTYQDNNFLAADDVYALENEEDEYYYNVYTLGNWGIIGKMVFKNWEAQDLSDLKSKLEYFRNGLDFGFTNDPTAFVRASRKHKSIYITDEMYKYGLTNEMIAQEILPIINEEPVWCDSAEPKSIYELTTYGVNAQSAMKGPGSLNFGIQWLKKYNIVIDKSCQNTINDFQLYQYKKNKDGEYLNIPVDKNNHSPDALRYGFSTEIFDEKKESVPHKTAAEMGFF